MREHKLYFLPLNKVGLWGWRAFVSLSEGKISICSLTVSSSMRALPLWPPRRRGSGHSWWSSHQFQTCVWRENWLKALVCAMCASTCVCLGSTFGLHLDNQLHHSGAPACMCFSVCQYTCQANKYMVKTSDFDIDLEITNHLDSISLNLMCNLKADMKM